MAQAFFSIRRVETPVTPSAIPGYPSRFSGVETGRHCMLYIVSKNETQGSPNRQAISESECTREDTPDVKEPPEDPDLALILDRWPKLPKATRSAIVRLSGQLWAV